MSNRQWGHGYYTGRDKGRKEASLLWGVTLLTLAVSKKSYSYFKESYPEKFKKFQKK